MPAIYLTVPFREKDEAKSLGARWDAARKRWYVPDGVDAAPFARWQTDDGGGASMPASPGAPAAFVPSAPPAPMRRSAPASAPTSSIARHDSLFDEDSLDHGLARLARVAQHDVDDASLPAVREPDAALAPAAPRGVPLSRLLTAVAGVVAQAFEQSVWVTAEVLRVSTAGQGHVYLELSERDAEGRVMAKAQATIWSRTARSIMPAFEKATGAVLAAGIKLMVRARPVFKAQYGFSLEIDAIDPSYTLGDLAARKREIRERLQREGLFDRNRRLPAPWDYTCVLVVAPRGAAGLGDFDEEARRLEHHGLCRFIYGYSLFQGDGAAAEILRAAHALLAEHPAAPQASPTTPRSTAHRPSSPTGPDALIIIRGGGAVNDLAWLDDYALARFICECPLPVLTGIGHERDNTVLDDVAHRSFDTPSKVVLGIEQRIAQRANEARDAMGLIIGAATDAIAARRSDVERHLAGVRVSAGQAIARARQQADRRMGQVQLGATSHRQLAEARTRAALVSIGAGARQQLVTARRTTPVLRDQILADARDALREATEDTEAAIRSVDHDARRVVHDASRMAEALMREVAGQGPQKTLGRGFAVVRAPDGRPLTSAAATASAGHLQIEFQDGRIDADVAPDAHRKP